jgi:hypothetical protein
MKFPSQVFIAATSDSITGRINHAFVHPLPLWYCYPRYNQVWYPLTKIQPYSDYELMQSQPKEFGMSDVYNSWLPELERFLQQSIIDFYCFIVSPQCQNEWDLGHLETVDVTLPC